MSRFPVGEFDFTYESMRCGDMKPRRGADWWNRKQIPICLYDGCTGASVQGRYDDRFCSALHAELYGRQQAERYTWCATCDTWHDAECVQTARLMDL